MQIVCHLNEKEMICIPINNAFFVQKFKSRDDLGCVESSSILFKPAALLNVEHQVATVQILHHKEQVRLAGF